MEQSSGLLPGRRPTWLVVERALGALQWQDTARDRQAFTDYVRHLAVEEIVSRQGPPPPEASETRLRTSLERGWYFRTEAFREQVLERARAATGKRSQAKQNYHGAEVRDHGEWEARKIIAQRLLEAGLKSPDLGLLPKGDPRKIRSRRKCEPRPVSLCTS